jgi:uncharacterized Zn finger protein
VSRRDEWGWYRSPPKKPPPEHGIKVRKSGTTWWGQRWIEALERMSVGYSNRLARGRSYARAGRAHDLVVKAGRVTARVTGSRASPYKVSMRIATLPDAAWAKAISAMAEKAQFAAALLGGQMPPEIDEAFRAGGISLFLENEKDLVTECSCPDWANPCKHVAAAHYVLGEAFDRDPFLLFELRGRTGDEVLAALRAARVGEVPAPGEPGGGEEAAVASGEGEIPTVLLGELDPADYDRYREAPPVLHLSFEEPALHGAVLRQLGAPAGWKALESPADLLEPRVRAAALEARRLALAEPEEEVPRLPPRGKRRNVSKKGVR